MAAPLSPASYTPCLNEKFIVHREDGITHDFILTAVDPGIDDEWQLSFSLLFRAPKDVLLRERIYALSHPRLGQFDLFLVPIRQKRDGILYEAVFNLLKDAAQ